MQQVKTIPHPNQNNNTCKFGEVQLAEMWKFRSNKFQSVELYMYKEPPHNHKTFFRATCHRQKQRSYLSFFLTVSFTAFPWGKKKKLNNGTKYFKQHATSEDNPPPVASSCQRMPDGNWILTAHWATDQNSWFSFQNSTEMLLPLFASHIPPSVKACWPDTLSNNIGLISVHGLKEKLLMQTSKGDASLHTDLTGKILQVSQLQLAVSTLLSSDDCSRSG